MTTMSDQEYWLQRAGAPAVLVPFLPFDRPSNIIWHKSKRLWQVTIEGRKRCFTLEQLVDYDFFPPAPPAHD